MQFAAMLHLGARVLGTALFALALATLVIGCGTPYVQQSEAAYAKLMATIQAANADGVLTASETEAITTAQTAYYTALKADVDATKGLDMIETLGVVAAAFVPGGAAIAAAVNAYRNTREKKVWGTPDAPKA